MNTIRCNKLPRFTSHQKSQRKVMLDFLKLSHDFIGGFLYVGWIFKTFLFEKNMLILNKINFTGNKQFFLESQSNFLEQRSPFGILSIENRSVSQNSLNCDVIPASQDFRILIRVPKPNPFLIYWNKKVFDLDLYKDFITLR